MHLEVTQVQGDGFTECAVVHDGQKIIFSASTYRQVKLLYPERVFNEINGYWSTLPQETQAKIWNTYKELKEYTEASIDQFHIVRYLKQFVHQLYSYMSMDDISKWLLIRGNLYIPSNIEDRITEDSRYPRHDRTYLKEDYINLSAMAVALRPMIPIWGEYFDSNKQNSANDIYKEMEAISLIIDTELTEWPPEKPAFDKLNTFIQITAKEEQVNLSNLWRGIGSAEIPMWLQAKVMVRRLSIISLCDHQVTHSIISNLHRYVGNNVTPIDRRTTDRVAEKRPDNAGMDDDDKTSFVEGYKAKVRVAKGDAVLFGHQARNIVRVVQGVDPTIDLNLLDRSLSTNELIEKMPIHQHQIRFAQWVLAKAYSPRAFYHIEKQAVVKLISGAQALLWHWGYPDIACFMQVERIDTTHQDAPGITHKPRGGSRIARRYDQELQDLYPHTKPQRVSNKHKDSADSVSRNSNFAAVGINNRTRDLMMHNWYFHGPAELKVQAGQPEGRGLLIVPPKIKDRITELVIDLAKLNQ